MCVDLPPPNRHYRAFVIVVDIFFSLLFQCIRFKFNLRVFFCPQAHYHSNSSCKQIQTHKHTKMVCSLLGILSGAKWQQVSAKNATSARVEWSNAKTVLTSGYWH